MKSAKIMNGINNRIEILIPPAADIPPRFKRGATFSIELSAGVVGEGYKGDVVVLSRYRLRNGDIRVKLETVSAATGTGRDD